MKTLLPILAFGAVILHLAGCARDPNRINGTNPYHPGPASGRAAGATTGVAAGNVAGAVVGTGEGFAAGASAPFRKTTRVVRTWRTETTADGRTIQVPVDTVVDENGRPVDAPKPAPPQGAR
jgi:hypothetical protein